MNESLVNQVSELLTVRCAPDVAANFCKYTPTAGDLSKAWRAARQTIASSPDRANSCVPMTADFLAQLQELSSNPIIVVAGAVQALDEVFVFGSEKPMDCEHLFELSDPDWDGHVWLMLGPYIADVSIIRTIRLDARRPMLRELVRRRFGPNEDALIMRWDEVKQRGLTYIPQCVLSEAQTKHLIETAGYPEEMQ
jgi:hypothetical protein